ncbi:hypothetical protein OIE13_30535 [Streptosporangium sp. NBC_01810]|uniref:restriction endonuclease, SacI family n=1 Tax=Streptosporangium sp. NBC_01810 TaxID=2975951 RepID=UPI002DDB062A|nr:hypothetical protein [Streptosporangium sp. NBC_01810]WSA25222.1 hypothetical protein OIE13_30535 [Streptosporangium sp. NBC_01810]
MATPEDRELAQKASNLVESKLRELVSNPFATRTEVAPEAQVWLDDLLSKNDTYRDATLAIIAFPVAAGKIIDIGISPPSRRGVTERITSVCRELSIPCKKDAFQTLGKGNARLDGLDRGSWKNLLKWASEDADIRQVEEAFTYFAEGVALLARPLPPMPSLATRNLTFPRVTSLLEKLLSKGSKGAYEQLIVAALLSAVASEEGSLRVETKNINASDASAGTTADIQVWRRGVLEEAFEVTANNWRTKIKQAAEARQDRDLHRVHIIASVNSISEGEIEKALSESSLSKNVDLSVLDVRHESRSLVARLSRPGRRTALETLYEYLKVKQPDDALVISYVEALESAGLVEDEE